MRPTTTRRRFIGTGVRAAVAAGVATSLGPLAGAVARAATASSTGATPIPEYAGTLDEMLVVYDQVRAGHLLREIVEIVRHAPPAFRLHVLVSRALRDEAASRLSAHGIHDASLLPSDAEAVSGDWGRDIFQIARDADGVRTVHVPWNKAATMREGLRRGVDQLMPLAREDLRVELLPAAFEGGNLMTDVTLDRRRVLFAGSTIAVETQALYARWFGSTIRAADVARILGEPLGAEEVVWIGPRDAEGRLVRQPHLLFHVDMGMTIVAPSTAVVARLDTEAPWPEHHRELLEEELARTREALAARRRAGLPADSLVVLPAPEDDGRYLDERVAEERTALRAAASHLDATAALLEGRGYRVHRIDTESERTRRFQSYTNVIPSRDRLIVPIYPSVDRVHGWTVPGPDGRDRVDVDLGIRDSTFILEEGNLRALELYRSLHPDVRVVRDYFYLASGNVHCVIGRLS